MRVTIERVTVPAHISRDDGDFAAFVDVGNACALQLWNNDDFVYEPADQLGWYRPGPFRLRMLYLARLDGEPVGRLLVTVPLDEDATTAEVDVAVIPPARRHGIGAALLARGEELVAEAGRLDISAFTEHVTAGIRDAENARQAAGIGRGSGSNQADDTEHGSASSYAVPTEQQTAGTVMPVTGPRGVPHDDATSFMLASGYTLGQVEMVSRLSLPLPPEVRHPLQRDADARSSGYRIVTWWQRCPDDLVDSYAAARARMVVDVPHEGIVLDAERWDAARVRDEEQRRIDSGEPTLVAAAVHQATGEVVAYTILLVAQGSTKVEQWDTLVVAAHRGHRLGLAVKLANLDALARVAPQVNRILTWNAGENAPMRAINDAIGFEPCALDGNWQKSIG
jgi:GNAT superfamily N-acetyltransferase